MSYLWHPVITVVSEAYMHGKLCLQVDYCFLYKLLYYISQNCLINIRWVICDLETFWRFLSLTSDWCATDDWSCNPPRSVISCSNKHIRQLTNWLIDWLKDGWMDFWMVEWMDWLIDRLIDSRSIDVKYILLCVVASNPLGMGLPMMGDGN